MARADKKFKAIRGILSLLSTDSTIRSYVEDKIYALIAPQDVEGDFIIIRRDGYRRQDTKMGVSLQASVFYVFVISDDYDRSLDIADKVAIINSTTSVFVWRIMRRSILTRSFFNH